MDRRQRLEQFEQEQSIAFGGGAIGAWPRHKGEKLRPHKGGGGGDGGARQMEEERQARINAAVRQINNIFNNKVLVDGDPANSREQMSTNQRQAVYDLNTRDVNRQAADAERLNRFALARNGLLGGSADVDSGFEINRMTNEGLMKAGGIADQAAADLLFHRCGGRRPDFLSGEGTSRLVYGGNADGGDHAPVHLLRALREGRSARRKVSVPHRTVHVHPGQGASLSHKQSLR